MKKLNNVIKASGTQQINYQGSITLKVLNNKNKTISTKKYHNNGLPNLFKFLALSLAGTRANELRPVKIKLFNCNKLNTTSELDENAITPAKFKWSNIWNDSNNLPIAGTPYIVYDTTPVVKRVANNATATSDDDYHYEMTLHFRIPFSYISQSTIHFIGLYPNNAINDGADASAYYLLTNEDGTKWKPLDLGETTSNYSIVIEWTLALTNLAKQKSTAASETVDSNTED